MDSNIPAIPAYGDYISQLVRYVRICTSKLDFIHRLRRLSSRLLQQGFKSTLLRKSLTKFFKRHSAIIEKYGTTLQEIRLAIQNLETPPYPLLFKILYIILATLFYFYIASIQFDADARAIFLKLCACLGYLVDVYLVRYLTYYIYFALFSILLLLVLTLWVTPSKMFCNWYRI